MKTMFANILGGLLATVIYFTVLAVVGADDAVDTPDAVAGCLPVDLGEKSILWLEHDQQGGMALHCEKHAVLAYGMAQVPVSKD